jgi:SAM-dependent methyltransferase
MHVKHQVFDLERVVPDLLRLSDPIEAGVLEIHQARYRFAAARATGKSVLDLACGVGYGSAILKEAGAASVLGVDLSNEAIEYARARYAAERVEFRVADAATFTPEARFELVVSLETIEHVPNAVGFVHRLASFVKPGGELVGSVPTTLSSDVNPYHLHDFSPREFRRLFRDCGLEIIDEMTQLQPFSPFGLLRTRRTSRRSYTFRPNLVSWYVTHPAMAVRRLACTLGHGFTNEYLTLVARKPR